jgi:predicted esterase
MKTNELSFVHRYEAGTIPGGATLLLLHGTGGSEDDLIDLGRSLLPRAALLSPRGQVEENGMARFFRRLAEGVFDLPDLHRRTADLAAFVEEAAVLYGFDPGKVVAVGYSNGANIAASLLLSRPGILAGAVLLHPMVPFEPETPVKLSGLPVFIAAGRADPLVSPALTERLVELLTTGGAAVETRWQDGGHRISPAEIEAAQAWIRKGERKWN